MNKKKGIFLRGSWLKLNHVVVSFVPVSRMHQDDNVYLSYNFPLSLHKYQCYLNV